MKKCPEKPELLAGAPLGMYHCPECGCMVLAGLPHDGFHTESCWLKIRNSDGTPARFEP